MGRYPWLVGAVLGLWPGVAHALTLAAGPGEQEITVAAGKTAVAHLVASNDDPAQTLDISVYAGDVWYDEKGAMTLLPAGTDTHSAATWVLASPSKTQLVPNGHVDIDVVVSPPPSAKTAYYAVIFVEGRPTGQTASLTPGGRIATLLMVRITGTGREALKVENSAVVPPTAATPLSIDLTVQDTGDVYEFSTLHAAIVDSAGKAVARVASEKPLRTLPGQTRHLVTNYTGALAPGSYRLVGAVVFGAANETTPVDLPFTVPP